MKCFYHRDMDGKCAGAIVHKYYVMDTNYEKNTGDKCEFIGIDYKDEFPFDDIRLGEKVVIVDFSLQKPGEFERLIGLTDDIIWIDHHKTAIEKHGNLKIRGLRQDGISGCELTWRFFYRNAPIPKVVSLLGDYDIWAFVYGDDTKNFQSGVRLYETNPESENWRRWLITNYYPESEIKEGVITTKYRDNYYAGLIKSLSFFTEFEGYKVVACNAGSVSSNLFDSVEEDYDIAIPFSYDGKQWKVSLFTKKDIDVSEIAKKYGGGGHAKAAGFQCKELPFKGVENI